MKLTLRDDSRKLANHSDLPKFINNVTYFAGASPKRQTIDGLARK